MNAIFLRFNRTVKKTLLLKLFKYSLQISSRLQLYIRNKFSFFSVLLYILQKESNCQQVNVGIATG
jgi:hypothetical protein